MNNNLFLENKWDKKREEFVLDNIDSILESGVLDIEFLDEDSELLTSMTLDINNDSILKRKDYVNSWITNPLSAKSTFARVQRWFLNRQLVQSRIDRGIIYPVTINGDWLKELLYTRGQNASDHFWIRLKGEKVKYEDVLQ